MEEFGLEVCLNIATNTCLNDVLRYYIQLGCFSITLKYVRYMLIRLKQFRNAKTHGLDTCLGFPACVSSQIIFISQLLELTLFKVSTLSHLVMISIKEM